MLVGWFVTTPLASFYLRVPPERSIITYDRVRSLAVMIVMVILKWRRADSGSSTKVSAAQSPDLDHEVRSAWALLSVAALASVAARSNNLAYATRMAVDSFWLPLIAFHIARNHLDIRRPGKALVLGSDRSALLLFVIGGAEFVTAADFFHFKRLGDYSRRRAPRNGPFISDSSYSIISLDAFSVPALGSMFIEDRNSIARGESSISSAWEPQRRPRCCRCSARSRPRS